MNIYATARFTLNLIISIAVLVILAFALLAPSLIPQNAAWFMAALALLGAVVLWTLAFLRPKETAEANDELVRNSEKTGTALGYWVTLLVFLVFLGCTFMGEMNPKTAFYYMGFPLGLVPSVYMVFAYFRGRAG
jgi:membrane protease YdiL (CAAX protease family)